MIIPANKEGKPTDLHYSLEYQSAMQASTTFRIAVDRLLQPRLWGDLAGWAAFSLRAFDGTELVRSARIGDYIRIDIPGPGTIAGEGFDWVKIAALEKVLGPEDNNESAAMCVHPSSAPMARSDDVAHFFGPMASSTFVIDRVANVVEVSYYGRNEVPNSHTGKTVDNIRNLIVAGGAIVGLSEAQWIALCKGFLS